MLMALIHTSTTTMTPFLDTAPSMQCFERGLTSCETINSCGQEKRFTPLASVENCRSVFRPNAASGIKLITVRKARSRAVKVRFAMENIRVREVTPSIDAWLDERSILRTAALLKRRANYIAENQPEVSRAIQCLRLSYEKGSDKITTRRSVKCLALSESRGLEQRLLPAIRVARKKAVAHLLLMQKKLKADGIVNIETRDYLLYLKSRQLSKESRQLALKLAQSDAVALRLDAKG